MDLVSDPRSTDQMKVCLVVYSVYLCLNIVSEGIDNTTTSETQVDSKSLSDEGSSVSMSEIIDLTEVNKINNYCVIIMFICCVVKG